MELLYSVNKIINYLNFQEEKDYSCFSMSLVEQGREEGLKI